MRVLRAIALIAAMAAVVWVTFQLPARQVKQTGLSGSRQAHRRTGAKGRHPHGRRPVANYLDRVFPIAYP